MLETKIEKMLYFFWDEIKKHNLNDSFIKISLENQSASKERAFTNTSVKMSNQTPRKHNDLS